MTACPRQFLHAAAATWNDRNESLEEVNARIHDGVPLDRLEERADTYIRDLFEKFPYVQPPSGALCLEIGSGTGYIMEALDRELIRRSRPAEAIIGLDIAEHMIAKGKLRLGTAPRFRFLHYDGVSVPMPNASLDLVYSVATLQHVPKPFVYNLFFEIKRLLKPSGFAVLLLLSFKSLSEQEQHFWRREVTQQISLQQGHWHHFYSKEEVETVLRIGTGFPLVDLHEPGGGIWVCVHKQPLPLPPDFDAARYLELNPDVQGTDPVKHWQDYGYREGRRWT